MSRLQKRPIVCRHCGIPEHEHCMFEAAMPDGCQCPPGEWGDDVLDVCPQFVGPGKQCSVCEHDEACHTSRPTLELTPATEE